MATTFPKISTAPRGILVRDFSTFHMEEPLERGRFTARWNSGESGGPALTLEQVLERHAQNERTRSKNDLLSELASLSLADSPNHGSERLRQAVARLHPGATPEHVLITTGTSEALLLLFLHLKPKKVALIQPGFQLLAEFGRVSGSEVVPLPLHWNARAQATLDIPLFVSIIERERPDLILFNHPHNPSGLVVSQNDLLQIQRVAIAVGATLIGDEHYRFLVETRFASEASSHPSELPLGPTLFRNDVSGCFVTGSFIKCLGTPGLRIGWVLGDPKTLLLLQNIKNYTTHTVNPISEHIATLVLESRGLADFGPSRAIWMENRKALRDFLGRSRHGWHAAIPEGGWVTCLTHDSFPETFHPSSKRLETEGCFLLDLRHMEFNETSATNCELARKGGFRLGLGMTPDSFRDMLSMLEDLGQSLR